MSELAIKFSKKLSGALRSDDIKTVFLCTRNWIETPGFLQARGRGKFPQGSLVIFLYQANEHVFNHYDEKLLKHLKSLRKLHKNDRRDTGEWREHSDKVRKRLSQLSQWEGFLVKALGQNVQHMDLLQGYKERLATRKTEATELGVYNVSQGNEIRHQPKRPPSQRKLALMYAKNAD